MWDKREGTALAWWWCGSEGVWLHWGLSVGPGLSPCLPGPSTGLSLGLLRVPPSGWGAGPGAPGAAGTPEGPSAEFGARG